MMTIPTLFDALPIMPRPLPGGVMTDPPRETQSEAKHFITIIIPGEPVAKGRPRVRIMRMGGKQVPQLYAPKETQDYEDIVRICARNALRDNPQADKLAPIDDKAMAMLVRVFVPIPQSWSKKDTLAALRGEKFPLSRPDADNYLKMACDALNGMIYRDDSLVTDMRVMKRYSENPRMEIEVFL